MNILDHRGRPIVDSRLKEEAVDKLKNFMEKNKNSFEDWIRQHGPIGFPIKFNIDTKEWCWLDK